MDITHVKIGIPLANLIAANHASKKIRKNTYCQFLHVVCASKLLNRKNFTLVVILMIIVTLNAVKITFLNGEALKIPKIKIQNRNVNLMKIMSQILQIKNKEIVHRLNKKYLQQMIC